MFISMCWHKDEITNYALNSKINYVGVEALFDSEQDEVCSNEYLQKMRGLGLLVWANAIIYNEKEVISAKRTDDVSLLYGEDKGWGWLKNKGFDFIQTDWTLELSEYLKKV